MVVPCRRSPVAAGAVTAAVVAGTASAVCGFVAPSASAPALRGSPAASTAASAAASSASVTDVAAAARSSPTAAFAAASLVAAAAVSSGLAARRGRRTADKTVRLAFPWPFEQGKKTVIITGASSGLGLAAAKQLALSGQWLVIMACRDFSKAEMKAKEAGFPEGSYKVMHCDLAANGSVRQFVALFKSLGTPLDALVCNAAVYFPNAHKQGAFLPGLFPGGGPRWSADGHELSFASNYLGHFLLVNLLLEDLKRSTVKPARCVILGTVTATVNGSELGGMIPPLANIGQLEGLAKGMKAPVTMLDGGEFDGAKAYKDSKVCDVMMMRELHKRFHRETGIVFTSMYPGCIAETNLFREHYPVFRGLFPVFQKEFTRAYVSEEEAGRRLACCVADDEYKQSGSYYSWQGKAGTGGMGGMEGKDNTEVKLDQFQNIGSFRTLTVDEIGGEAGNNERCKQLWELSEKLLAGNLQAAPSK
mmetsp:Transcript_84621/g.215434  ORF Transcript_84621/g.215434 Transcript_84621/m.215434 type:complete len:476 (-) Transcript_84621:329-1756(-)